jgi:hypothetical protein
MAAQTIAEHGVLRFAVADAGVGLRATLAAIGADDDRQAVQLALAGERRLRTPGRGYGLPATVRIITELDGELLLASGLASARVTPAGSRERQLEVAFTGTIFEGSVPARVPAGSPGRRRPASVHRPAAGSRRPPDAVPSPGEVKQ